MTDRDVALAERIILEGNNYSGADRRNFVANILVDVRLETAQQVIDAIRDRVTELQLEVDTQKVRS